MSKLTATVSATLIALSTLAPSGAQETGSTIRGASFDRGGGGFPGVHNEVVAIDLRSASDGADGIVTYVVHAQTPVLPIVGFLAVLDIDCVAIIESPDGPDEFFASGINILPAPITRSSGSRFAIGGTIEATPQFGLAHEASEGPCGSADVRWNWRAEAGAFVAS